MLVTMASMDTQARWALRVPLGFPVCKASKAFQVLLATPAPVAQSESKALAASEVGVDMTATKGFPELQAHLASQVVLVQGATMEGPAREVPRAPTASPALLARSASEDRLALPV